jgi:flagellar biosynthesis/type III secretory pathway protein FliH
MSSTLQARYKGRAQNALDLLTNARFVQEGAEAKASITVQSARKRAAGKIAAARTRARRLGREQAERTSQTDLLKKFLDQQLSYEKAIQAAHHDCLELALRVAKEVLQIEVALNSESLASRVSAALKAFVDSQTPEIHVNPENLENIKTSIGSLLGDKKYKLIPQSAIEPGNALLVSKVGSVAIDWITHLEQIRAQLRKALRQRQEIRDRND